MTDASTGAREAAANGPAKTRVGGVWAPAGFSWALFEFARNPYYMLIVTYVFPVYFANVVIGDPVAGQASVSEATKWAGVVGALTAPLLGAMMDRGGARKPLMGLFLGMIAVSGVALWWSLPGGAGLGVAGTMSFLVLGFVGYTYSELTHNAMLNSAGRPDALSRISGAGIGLGQLSSAICLAVFVVLFSNKAGFGLNEASAQLERGTGPVVAVWMIVLVIPFFMFMPDGAPTGGSWKRAAAEVLGAILPRRATPKWYWFVLCFAVVFLLFFSVLFAMVGWQNPVLLIGAPAILGVLGAYFLAPRLGSYFGRYVRELPETMKYLAARLIYADGIIALLSLGGVYTSGVLGWDGGEVALYGIYASIFGVVGGFLAGSLDKALGARKAIMLELAVLCVGIVIALGVTQTTILYGLIPSGHVVHGLPIFNTLSDVFYLALIAVIAAAAAACISSSRYMMVVMAPKDRLSEFFGLYALSSTATVWLGPMLTEFATRASGDQRIGFAPVLLLLAVGLALMFTLKGDMTAPGSRAAAA